MPALGKAAIAAAIIALLAPTLVMARPVHRLKTTATHAYRAHSTRYKYSQRRSLRRSYTGVYGPPPVAYPYPSAADDPYNPYALPGAAIRAQAHINQNAPGLTNELAPGNIATATGGPSGGVPGFSGH